MYGTFRNEIASNPALGLLIVLDDFIASFHPILDQAEQALYELEDQILRTPREAQLQQLSTLRQQLSSLHRLWEPQREAVVLRHCQDLSLDNISCRLGRTRAAAASLLRRGLARLRERLGSAE